MIDVRSLIRPHLRDIIPYSSARNEFEGDAEVFLDANENAFGSVGGEEWNRYPDPYQIELKKKIAEIKNVAVDQVFLGNGSDEPIDLLIRAFCEPGIDKIATLIPTYGMYKVSANIHNVSVIEFPLNEEFQFDQMDVTDRHLDNVKIFFLCSPNNPSGNLLDQQQIEQLLDRLKCVVVIDEAYIDFCEEHSHLEKINQYPNLVILQTFSKAWGLASFRLGMAFANQNIVQLLNNIKPPYNLNGPIQQMAKDAIGKKKLVNAWVVDIIEQRKLLSNRLSNHETVEYVYPSDANFLLVRFYDSATVFEYLINEGIVVRDRSSVRGCERCLRITVGTSQENNLLMQKLDKLNRVKL
jgi:histidinol-phosphate aminotransferase